MSDFQKVLCVYHPDLFITNFCKEKSCLMPLCPSCIGAHNQYHDNNGIRATYSNITDILGETQSKIYTQMVSLQEVKKRNALILTEIYNLPKYIHEKIVIVKNEAYNAIDLIIQQLQKEIISTFEKRHDQIGIFSLKKSEKYQSQLNNAIIQLDDMQYMLKSDQCLASVIKFFSESQRECNLLFHQVQTTLSIEQNYYPEVVINSNLALNLKSFLQKLINFQTTKLPQKYYQEEARKVSYQTVPEFNKISNSRIRRTVLPLQRDLSPPKITKVSTSPIIVSQIGQQRNYSPIRPVIYGRESSPNRNNIKKVPKYDEQFENLSKQLAQMRKQNELLTKVLKKT